MEKSKSILQVIFKRSYGEFILTINEGVVLCETPERIHGAIGLIRCGIPEKNVIGIPDIIPGRIVVGVVRGEKLKPGVAGRIFRRIPVQIPEVISGQILDVNTGAILKQS